MFPDTVKQAQGKSVVKPGFRGRGRLKYKLRRQKTAMKNVANHSSSFPYLLISVALSRAKLFFMHSLARLLSSFSVFTLEKDVNEQAK